MKKLIIFLLSSDYLCNPPYFKIADQLSGFFTIYLNTRDTPGVQVDESEVLKHFDRYIDFQSDMYPANLSRRSRIDRSVNLPAKFARVVKYNFRFRRLLDGLDPCAVVGTSDMGYSARIAIQWARRRGRRFFLIQPSFFDFGFYRLSIAERLIHVVMNRGLRIPFARSQTYWGNEDGDTTVFVWGDFFRRIFLNKSVYPNVRITGNPNYAAYFSPLWKRGRSNRVAERLSLRESGSNVLYCSHALNRLSDEETDRLLQDMIDTLIVSNPQIDFIIKPHPRADFAKTERHYDDLGVSNCRVSSGYTLPELLEIADLQISVFSATSLEAVAAGVPIILVNPRGRLQLLDFFQRRIEERATEREELLANVRRCLSPEYYQSVFVPRRETYLRDMVGYMDEDSATRIAESIVELACDGHLQPTSRELQ